MREPGSEEAVSEKRRGLAGGLAPQAELRSAPRGCLERENVPLPTEKSLCRPLLPRLAESADETGKTWLPTSLPPPPRWTHGVSRERERERTLLMLFPVW